MGSRIDTKKESDLKPPNPPDTVERAQQIAIQALERLEKLTLKPTPQFYELWYRYYEGDPEIVAAIDGYTGIFDENTCLKIHKRYLSISARDDAVRKVTDEVQHAIAELAGMLGAVKSATSEYGENLGDVKDQIQNAESLDDLSAVVSVILHDTKVMVEKNQELEEKLVTSSDQVTELKKNLDNVRKESLTDGLTGVANRKAFDKNILDLIEEGHANNTPLVLMMVDIDFFKKFNDAYGHVVGDQVLKLVARTLVENVKGRDIVSRYGGEEFAVLLPETPLEPGLKVAEMLRRTVENKEVVNKTNNEILGRITMSMGVAEYVPDEGVSRFIERADAALYMSKKNGRNRVSPADQPAKHDPV